MSLIFQQEKMVNKTLIIPTKAFWQPRKSLDLSCNACIPYIAIDKINGELTCRICGHQTYREKRMKTHIEVSTLLKNLLRYYLLHKIRGLVRSPVLKDCFKKTVTF